MAYKNYKGATFFIIICFTACSMTMSCNTKKSFKTAENYIIDSLTIDSIGHTNELLNLILKDSNTILSFNRNDNTINHYHKKNSTFQLIETEFLPIDGFCMESCFFENKFIAINRKKNILYLYDLSSKSLKKYNVDCLLPYLSNNFLVASTKQIPINFLNDAQFIAGTYFKSTKFYKEYYSGKFIRTFSIKNDALLYDTSFISIPSSHGVAISGSYKLVGNNIIALFPYTDSLFIYNKLNKGVVQKHIGNQDYKKPDPWNIEDILDTKKVTEFNLSNFQYKILYQDYQNQNNLLLFYNAKVDKTSEHSNPTYQDQKLSLLVTDINLEKKSYFVFKKRYYNPGSCLQYKKMFLGLPVYNQFKKNGKIVFYIFNFSNSSSKLRY